MRDGRIIDLKLSTDNFAIYFIDYYLLLPSLLNKLAINFNVENKGILPYKF